MAVKIPQYGDRLTPSGFGVVPQARGVEVNSSVGQALQNVGTAGQHLAGVLIQKENVDATANVYGQLSKADVSWFERLKTLPESMVDGGNIKQDDGSYVTATTKIQGDYDKWAEGFLSGVTNPVAKAAAQKHITDLREQTIKSTMLLEAKADIANRSTKFDGAIEEWKKVAAQNPAMIDQLATSAKTMAANIFTDENTKITKAQKAVIDLAEAAASGAVISNPKGLLPLLHDRMGHDVDTTTGTSIAPSSSAAPAASPSASVDQVWDKLTKTESGGKQFKPDGTPITSKKGAIGIAQIMPGTMAEAAKLAGLEPDLNRLKNDPEYNAALGKAYLQKQFETFGDPAKALAAYNMGPGKADGSNGLRRLLKEHPDNWLAYAPKETQNYVKSILGDQSKAAMPKDEVAAGDKTLQPVAVVATGRDPVLQKVVDNLPQDRILPYLHAAQSEINKVTSKAQSGLNGMEKDHLAAFAQGEDVAKPITRGEFVSVFGAQEGNLRADEYDKNRALGAEIKAVSTMTVDEQKALLDKHGKDPNAPGYANEMVRKNALATAIDTVNQMRFADPMTYMAQKGLANIKPIDWNKMPEAVAELKNRVGASIQANQKFGTPLMPLTKAEASNLSAGFALSTSGEKLRFISGIQDAVKDPNAYKAIMQQIAPDSTVTAMAGMIMNQTKPMVKEHWFGAPTVIDPKNVAQIMLEGEAIINPSKGAQKQDGKGGESPLPKQSDFDTAFGNAVGNAFAGRDAAGRDAAQGVKAYYVGKSARDGDRSGIINSDRMDEAIDAVLGGVSKFRGNQVLRPWGMSEDGFKDTLQNKFDEQMKQHDMKASFGSVSFRNFGNNTYKVVVGTDYLSDPKTNQNIIIDLNTTPTYGSSTSGKVVIPTNQGKAKEPAAATLKAK